MKGERETVVSMVRDLIGLWLIELAVAIMTREQLAGLVKGIAQGWLERKIKNG